MIGVLIALTAHFLGHLQIERIFPDIVYAILLLGLYAFIVVTPLYALVKIHFRIEHRGWKRLMTVASLAAALIAIVIGYQATAPNDAPSAFLTITGYGALGYGVAMIMYVTVLWVQSGFEQSQ